MLVSLFLKFFGNTSQNRIVDFLLSNQDKDHSISEISRQSGVGYTTTKVIKKKLLRLGFIRQTRKIGRAKMYIVNKKSRAVKGIEHCYNSLNKLKKQK